MNWDKIVGALGFATLLNFVLGVVAGRLSNANYITIFKVLIIFVFITIIASSIEWYSKKKRRQSWIEYIDSPPPYKGLITMVSTQPTTTPAESALIQHLPTLTHCWLLYTDQSKNNFNFIKNKYEEMKDNEERYEGDDGHKIIIDGKHVEDPDDIKEAFDLVKSAYSDAATIRLKEHEIITDFTGGTANVSVAMAMLSALSKNRKLEYLKPEERDKNGRPILDKGSIPLTIDLIIPGE